MSMIKTARLSIGLSQQTFGAFLAAKIGRDAPFPKSRISEYENGHKTPHKRVRKAVCYLAARAAAGEIRSINLDDADYMSKVARLIVDSQS